MVTNSCLIPLDYETRNLGRPSYAVTDDFLNSPDEQLLVTSLRAAKSSDTNLFAQAKIARDQSAATGILERNGFSFIETALVPTTNLAKNEILATFSDSPSKFLPRRYDPASITLQKLEKGNPLLCARVREIAAESFTTDRFHMDPLCPQNAANRRYINWTNDLLTSDADFDLLLHKGTVAGYMARKENHLILAGFARAYVASGLGDYLWLGSLLEMKKSGIIQVHTQISTNNLPVMNLYVRLGFKFKESFTMLHYWNS